MAMSQEEIDNIVNNEATNEEAEKEEQENLEVLI